MRGDALQTLGLLFVLVGASNQVATAAADGYADAGGLLMTVGVGFGVVGALLSFGVDAWAWRKANEEPLEG